MSWHLLKDRRHEGPFSRDELLQQVLQGELKLEAYLIREEDLAAGLIQYVRVSSVVGEFLPATDDKGTPPTAQARREVHDPESIDAFGSQAPAEDSAASLSASLQVEAADLVSRPAGTSRPAAKVRPVAESSFRTREVPRSTDHSEGFQAEVSELSGVARWLTGQNLGRAVGALGVLWLITLAVDRFGAQTSARQRSIAAESQAPVRSPPPRSRRQVSRPPRPAPPPTMHPAAAQKIMPSDRPGENLPPEIRLDGSSGAPVEMPTVAIEPEPMDMAPNQAEQMVPEGDENLDRDPNSVLDPPEDLMEFSEDGEILPEEVLEGEEIMDAGEH